jgi:hypothetical protein
VNAVSFLVVGCRRSQEWFQMGKVNDRHTSVTVGAQHRRNRLDPDQLGESEGQSDSPTLIRKARFADPQANATALSEPAPKRRRELNVRGIRRRRYLGDLKDFVEGTEYNDAGIIGDEFGDDRGEGLALRRFIRRPGDADRSTPELSQIEFALAEGLDRIRHVQTEFGGFLSSCILLRRSILSLAPN